MTIRRCNRMLLGVGALIGLCSAGCQNGLVGARPSGLLEAMAARRGVRPSAEILRPRAIAMRSSPTTIATSAPVAEAPVTASPIVRTSAEEMPGSPVEASSWRPTSSTSDADPSAALDMRADAIAPAAQAEQLPPPRPMGQGMSGTLVSSHTVHGGTSHVVMHSGHHGYVHTVNVPREGSKAALPPYVIEPPDIMIVQLLRDPKRVPQPVSGQFLVRPDGSISLGVYGTVHVGGMTIDEAKAEIVRVLRTRLADYETTDDMNKKTTVKLEDEVVVDIDEYASKFCYLISDGGGRGAQVTRIAINGSDTVLDAIGKLGGLPPQAAKKKIWLARPATHQVLPIDWKGISEHALVATNYQVFPGDRIFVQSDPRIRALSNVEATIAPFERITGGVLLGASAKNALIGGRNNNNNNNTGN